MPIKIVRRKDPMNLYSKQVYKIQTKGYIKLKVLGFSGDFLKRIYTKIQGLFLMGSVNLAQVDIFLQVF